MAVVNQELEDDNKYRSEGSTSSIDEIARVSASNEAKLKLVMIRLYKEIMWPMIHADQFEDDNNHGFGGSTSSIDELARVSASTETDKELMMHIYEETISPMICAEIMAKQQKFLSMIRQKFGFDLLTSTTWNFGNTASTSGSQALQLLFLNGISTPVPTGEDIKGKDNKPFVLALVDRISGEIVSIGAEAAMGVEIVVLEVDSNDDEAENWTSDEFNSKIVREWNRRKVLQGTTSVNLKDGIVSLVISFTHNSTWKGNKSCRLGARSVNDVLLTSVKQAKTESFLVTDKRNLLYKKSPIPSSSDKVYQLNKISRRGDCFKRLSKANIKTVMDLLTLHAINPERLKKILDVQPNTWKDIMEHAHMCKDDKGIYLYHHPRDGQKSNGIVFNISGQLVGLIEESQFVLCDKLPYHKMANAQGLIVSSSEHWEELVPFNDLASLINHLQSHTTLNSFRNNLTVLIPETIDTHHHTNLTSPQVLTPIFPIGWCTNNKNNWGYDNIGVASQSQSPKRPAFDHTISNSPKKPKNDHFPMSPSMPSVVTSRMTHIIPNNLEHSDLPTPEVIEDDDITQYLNDFEFDNWKMVWYAVEWISMISKVRKRRMTFCRDDTLIVIEASTELV